MATTFAKWAEYMTGSVIGMASLRCPEVESGRQLPVMGKMLSSRLRVLVQWAGRACVVSSDMTESAACVSQPGPTLMRPYGTIRPGMGRKNVEEEHMVSH
jgi:hypothetical protein